MGMLRAHGLLLCFRTVQRPCGEVRGRQSRLEEPEAAACTGGWPTVHDAALQEAAADGERRRDLYRGDSLAETMGETEQETEGGDGGSVRPALSTSVSWTLVNDE